MINSMTAFASVERASGPTRVNIEIRTYNHRHLDIALRLPQTYLSLEEKIKSTIAAMLARGRVEMKVQIREESDVAVGYEIDLDRARALHDVLRRLAGELDLAPQIPLEFFFREGNIIKPAEVDSDVEACWPVVKEGLDEALKDLITMRKREGDHIAADFKARLAWIEAQLDNIANQVGDLLPQYQERLKGRMAALCKGIVEIDAARLAQEAAFLADRSDIAEEIVRARSHLSQFGVLMQAAEPAGRKLNFLLQELNREFNTIGSKVERPEIAHMVVAIKSELEKIREQVQNVE